MSLSNTGLHAALRPLALILMAAGITFTVADPDLWGHLRFGLDILNDRGLPTGPDRYSFTADRSFVYHEWLGGTIMAAAYRAGGATGLHLLKAALAAAIFALLWSTLRRSPFVWRWGGLAVAAAGLLPMLQTLRPQLWSALGVIAVTRLLMSASPRALIALPAVFAVWANLHGGWIVGAGIVAIFTACAFLERRPRRWRLLHGAAAALAATLLTPYGATLWAFLAETIRFSRPDIGEWQPLWRAGWDSLAVWSATVAIVIATARRRRLPLETIIVVSVLAFAAAAVDRVSPLFAAVTVTILSREWHFAAAPMMRHRARAVIDGLAVAAALAALTVAHGPVTCIALKPQLTPDTAAGEALRGASGHLATFFDWGEYAIWHFGPALQVSIDGRREAVYRDTTFRAQQQIAVGTPLGLKTLEQMRADYVWLPAASPARAWLEAHGYRIDVESARSFVAARSDHAPLEAWQGSSSGCFPGP